MAFDLPQHTMRHFFDKTLELHGPRPALALVGEEPFTYAELGQRVETMRQYLHALGLNKGDKIAIFGPSSPNWVIAFMATMTMGAIAVPIMDEFPEADVDHIIRHAEIAAMFIAEPLLQNLSLPGLKTVDIVLDLKDFAPLNFNPDHQHIWEQLYTLEPTDQKLLPGSTTDGFPVPTIPDIAEDDIAEILYTSGTTGHSKGVMLTHKNLVTNAMVGPDALGPVLNENSVVLLILPLAHAFGSTSSLMSVLYRGAQMYFIDRKPSPKILMGAMQKVRPHVIPAVPLIFEKVYDRQVLPRIKDSFFLRTLSKLPFGQDLLYKIIGRRIKQAFGGRLACAVIGGAKLGYEVELFLRKAGIPYVCGYGMSECAPLLTVSTVETNRLGAVGKAVSGVSLKIVNKDASGVGEILAKGPNVMAGYFKNESATQGVFTPDGWLITGDRGYLDKDGFLYIKGRSKNVIVASSGENIFPEAIEHKFKESIYVDEVLVHMLEGQLVARIYPNYAYIENQLGSLDEDVMAAKVTELLETVRKEVNQQLSASARVQRIVEQQEPFIKTPTNKIKRAHYIPEYIQA